ncbi:MAG: DUF5667 domain-containing protein [Pseudonocardiales bacterium]
MAEHRVSMLSASLRRFEDPAQSSDPRIRALVAQLATVEAAPAPRAHFRAELRAQLVAVAPRLVAEGPAIETRRPGGTAVKAARATDPAKLKLASAAGWASKISIARPLAAVTAVIAVFALLLGGAVWVSKNALPGDTLYSLKRANENVALSLTNGDAAKGHKYLKMAGTRAEEVSALVSRSSSMAAGPGATAAGGVNAHTARLISRTLDSADSDTRSGAKLLNSKAVSSGSDDPLAIMIGWAPGQVARLDGIAGRLGLGPLHDRVIGSARVVAQAYARAIGLRPKVDCNCLNQAPTDEFGPKPCTTGCTAAPSPTQQPGTGTTGKSAVPRQSPTQGSHTVPAPGGGTATNPPITLPGVSGTPSVPGGSVGSAGSSAGGGLPLPLPSASLPLPSVSLPGSIISSSASATCILFICVG